MFASSIMRSEEKTFIDKAFDEGFTNGNTAKLEKETSEFIGIKHAVALSSGTALISVSAGLAKAVTLHGKRVF